MNLVVRLFLLCVLFLTSQSGIAMTTGSTEHQYDVNHIALGENVYGYDTTSNTQYCCQVPSVENTQDRSFLAFVSDFIVTKSGVGGLLKAGQQLDRTGSVFPKSTGNAAARNQQGQDILRQRYF